MHPLLWSFFGIRPAFWCTPFLIRSPVFMSVGLQHAHVAGSYIVCQGAPGHVWRHTRMPWLHVPVLSVPVPAIGRRTCLEADRQGEHGLCMVFVSEAAAPSHTPLGLGFATGGLTALEHQHKLPQPGAVASDCRMYQMLAAAAV